MNRHYRLQLLSIFLIMLCSGCEPNQNEATNLNQTQIEKINDDVYRIGKEISIGIFHNQLEKLKRNDSIIDYQISTSQDKFTFNGNTWPIINASMNVEGATFKNAQIDFILFLEISKDDEVVVGTVKKIKSNGNKFLGLNHLENSMFANTSEGIIAVEMVAGKLRKK